MAMLRNREVRVERAATEMDGSTFEVRYPDGQNEFAKMHELEFTRSEYEKYVHVRLPEVKIIEEPQSETKAESKKK